MPFKLIGTLILLVLVTIFAGFNINNTCNINFIFREFKNVPIFFSLVVSFVAGVFVTLPFTFGKKKNKAEKDEKSAEDKKLKKLKKKNKKAEEKVAISPDELNAALDGHKLFSDE
ncbi:MAG: hypothetical protein K5640_09830 [Treponema sp.]|nr:hypothetical protein [Treponema sp.]